ncbi:MAG: hypothetical protein ACE5F3_00610 [Mariprofundaceae bacterium]
MQHDLDRLRRHKQSRHRLFSVLAVSIMAALTVVIMRSCADQFTGPYNKGYQPMDAERQQLAGEER